MYWSQATIDSLIGEHVAIRGHMELVRGLTQEWEKLLASEEPVQQGDDRLKTLADKLASLRQAMGYLDDGLKNHHAHEAEVMPPLVGNRLWKAIWIEHDEMLKMMNEVNSLVINTSLELFWQKGVDILQKIDELRRFTSAHSIKEDGILLLLKKLPELQ